MPLRHHSLVAWQRADDLFIKLHILTNKAFPASERYELGGQLRRAAYSVPANIVEGYARRYRRSRVHFLNIAESSLAEVGYCLHVAKRLGYINDETYAELESEVRATYAPLVGLIRSASTLQIAHVLMGLLAAGALRRWCWEFFNSRPPYLPYPPHLPHPRYMPHPPYLPTRATCPYSAFCARAVDGGT